MNAFKVDSSKVSHTDMRLLIFIALCRLSGVVWKVVVKVKRETEACKAKRARQNQRLMVRLYEQTNKYYDFTASSAQVEYNTLNKLVFLDLHFMIFYRLSPKTNQRPLQRTDTTE